MAEPDWKLIYFGSRYRKWIAEFNPLPDAKHDVMHWARHVTRTGPPSGIGISPSGEDYADWVGDDTIIVFARIDYEEVVAVLEIY